MIQLSQMEKDGLEEVFAVLNVDENNFFTYIASLIKKYISIF